MQKERKEIEEQLTIMNPFLQLEFLEKKLKEAKTFDVKRFIHLKLAEIYEGKKMITEAARNMENAAEIGITVKEKKEDYLKAVELYTISGDYEKAELVLKKALGCGDEKEKEEMKLVRKNILISLAEKAEKDGMRNNALKIYEHLFRISSDVEKRFLKEKLIELYEKLGKMREASSLRGI